jgi:oligopeptide transport system ATP-binding protein
VSAVVTSDGPAPAVEDGQAPLLRVRDVVQEFHLPGKGTVHACSGVSLDVREGEALGVVGESGSGKSTLVRSILQSPRPKSGQVLFQGRDMTRLSGKELLATRRHVQTVYQDPFGSLEPRWKALDIIAEPLVGYGVGDRHSRRARAAELLEMVGLDPAVHGRRKPAQLSGGQCQRVAIARALALQPKLLILDEAVSSLDVLSQSQVMILFEKLRTELSLAYLFVAHDLAVVKQVSDRVAVMYLGKLCEVGPAQELYAAPRHPYTSALLASVPSPVPGQRAVLNGRGRAPITGEVPSALAPPSGCRFRTRCPRAQERCAVEAPQQRPVNKGTGSERTGGQEHTVACHFPIEQPGDGPVSQENQ